MKFKNKLLLILSFLWMRLLPILLVCGFFVGVHFNLWKELELSFGLALFITVSTGSIALYGFGKLLKFW
jgi:hypothetical protein